jgi:lipoprotein-anchoring transpeptidase ErfK/SrfK
MISFAEVAGSDGKIKLEARISPDQVAGYVQSIANQIDIAPINKKVVVRNGVESVEREGKDGRAISQQAVIDSITNGLQKNQNVEVNLTANPVGFKTEYNRTVSLDYSRYIEVNLNQQKLWAWQDNQVIFSTPITSGASGYGFGTPVGLFSIYAKERSRYLNGAQYGWGYNVYVDYWMPFSGGVGLHDADWRSSFGGQDYINAGSHGCVNMTKSAAAYLYGWATIGTPVWVHY